VGEQGTGKTTAVRRATYAWCQHVSKRKSVKESLTNSTSKIKYFTNMLISMWKPIAEGLDEVERNIGKNETHPELLLAFELKNSCNQPKLEDLVSITIEGQISHAEIKNIINHGSKTILLIFDGYDEYTKKKVSSGISQEIDAVIWREERKNYNLVVTTRPWKSEDLLSPRRLTFEKVSIISFDTDNKRNSYIEKFFEHNKPREEAKSLITALANPNSVVPKEILSQPRMLLYICNMWKDNKEIREDGLLSGGLFWNDIWSLMRRTYNLKYPESKISKEDLTRIRRKLAIFMRDHKDLEMSFDTFYDQFGEDGGDLFYFGVYSIGTSSTPEWEIEDEANEQEDLVEVKPIFPWMIQEDAKAEESWTSWLLLLATRLLFLAP